MIMSLSDRQRMVFGIALFLWFVGDLVSTYLGFLNGASEQNPFWSWVSINLFWVLVVAKFVGAFIIFCCIFLLSEFESFFVGWEKTLAHFCTWLAIFVLLFIGLPATVWNLALLL